MKRALYVGSFDPLTYGHLNIMERAADLVDELIVVVSASTAKNYLFSEEERLSMVKDSLLDRNIENCQIIAHDGLTVKLAREKNARLLIRGIRSVKDFEYERDIADLNSLMDEGIETLCLISDAKYQSISSTMVKEIAFYGGDVHQLVPSGVEDRLKKAMMKVDKNK
ncbi:Phosphopantetheine adenylyltransferase [Alkalibacterium putridalgicola]|uniref:Phosphopantetheine adenylyltransferase n=1 Tax=Alkalibacterium putridalgicola TaxID=426703 RepID=A0A1H7Q7B2_9LACT|nr:pantetheine-phosphate adenylyltransferase [Alkalibacterium putridalgicola]GEK88019.1 phosphopantetheine adenylyltransferase [Alkalibacterium putridalgicola]SEL43699.1 Phosphopantetheine adenylyltransferase [Alkalibacterium putridalgicola]